MHRFQNSEMYAEPGVKSWYFFSQWKWKGWPPLLFQTLHFSMLWEYLHTKHYRELKWRDILPLASEKTDVSPPSNTETWCVEPFVSQFQRSQIFFCCCGKLKPLAFNYLWIWATTGQRHNYLMRGNVSWKSLESHFNNFCKLSLFMSDSFWNA